eukprot:1813365-Rhodomonas_salina.3
MSATTHTGMLACVQSLGDHVAFNVSRPLDSACARQGRLRPIAAPPSVSPCAPHTPHQIQPMADVHADCTTDHTWDSAVNNARQHATGRRLTSRGALLAHTPSSPPSSPPRLRGSLSPAPTVPPFNHLHPLYAGPPAQRTHSSAIPITAAK